MLYYLFPEWMEFSPYDIGMPKYGPFMRPELFGCKFFIGQICQRYPEPPLHFLQGKLHKWLKLVKVFMSVEGCFV